ncbi:ethanolamine ammonia-lyase subunit EutC [Granulicella tundricola]|uniref:Ethanolamine ammonia-lyase small subunit n=1 Tax=Granulicella tundricola (strain ATCC BAA-1859 / DSM 23138 / MP5ACTX9) TaxID=1198114 RepID=E8X4S1_GRATM|nr:ethanolamine ammonia-lyase subunit EutC [Granulicella tundricola]ADW70560.1 Ethanolamine ammonia-lyase [Granulicella tundricola MP5ACTX9]
MSSLVRGLRGLTPARVSLGTAGRSLATEEVLRFQLDHARARDAVRAELGVGGFARRLRDEVGVEVVELRSRARDRAEYLRHPELGRALGTTEGLVRGDWDLGIVVCDGLSSLAVERNVVPLLSALLPMLEGWSVGPVAVVAQGRVAVGDEVGERMGARCCLVLIGERPGLSAADSLGAYLTWGPRVGRTDAERNCLSNIRVGGLDVDGAAGRLMGLLRGARARGGSGVGLKEGVLRLG